MFYYISGKLSHLTPGLAVVDVHGVGYKMTISQTTFSAMTQRVSGAELPTVKLYSYLAIREDDIELFGFATEEELDSFKMLITVSGVGPKAGIAILSELTPQKLAFAICNEDKKAISAANGVGPKTAARIILELKDKLKGGLSLDPASGATVLPDNGMLQAGRSTKETDAMDALTVLGYSKAEAAAALRGIDLAANELDDIIRLALKKLI